MANFQFTDAQWFNFICGFRGGTIIGSSYHQGDASTIKQISTTTEPKSPASERDIIGFKVGSVTLQKGSSYASVPVSILGTNITYSGFSFYLSFDPSKVQFISYELKELSGVQFSVDNVRGIVRAIMLRDPDAEEIKENKLAFNLTFEVLHPTQSDIIPLNINNTSWTNTNYTTFLKYVDVEQGRVLFFITPLNNESGRIIVNSTEQEVTVPEPDNSKNQITITPAEQAVPPFAQAISTKVPMVMIPTATCEPGHTQALNLQMLLGNLPQASLRFKLQFTFITPSVHVDADVHYLLNFDKFEPYAGFRVENTTVTRAVEEDCKTRFVISAEVVGKFSTPEENVQGFPETFALMYVHTDPVYLREVTTDDNYAIVIYCLNKLAYSHYLDSQGQPITAIPFYQRQGGVYWNQRLFDTGGMAGTDGSSITNPFVGHNSPQSQLPSEGVDTDNTIIPNQPDGEQESGTAVVGTIWSASSGLIWVTVGGYTYSVWVEPGPNRLVIWIPYYSSLVNTDYLSIPGSITIKTDLYILISAGFTWFTLEGTFVNPKPSKTHDEYEFGTTDKIEPVKIRDLFDIRVIRPGPGPSEDTDAIIDEYSLSDFYSLSSSTVHSDSTAHTDEFEITDFDDLRMTTSKHKRKHIEEYSLEDFYSLSSRTVHSSSTAHTDDISIEDFVGTLLIVPTVPITSDNISDDFELEDISSQAIRATYKVLKNHIENVYLSDFVGTLLIVPTKPVTADTIADTAEFQDFLEPDNRHAVITKQPSVEESDISDFCIIEKN